MKENVVGKGRVRVKEKSVVMKEGWGENGRNCEETMTGEDNRVGMME